MLTISVLCVLASAFWCQRSLGSLDSNQFLSARRLLPLRAYKDAEIFRYHIPGDVVAGRWRIKASFDDPSLRSLNLVNYYHKLMRKRCEPMNVTFHLRWGAVPLLNINNASIPENLLFEPSEQYEIALASDGQLVTFNISNPLPGDWFGVAYLNDVDDRIHQKGLGHECGHKVTTSLTFDSFADVFKYDVVDLVEQPLAQNLTRKRYYKFFLPRGKSRAKLLVSRCSTLPPPGDDQLESTVRCPLMIYVRPLAFPRGSEQTYVNCSQLQFSQQFSLFNQQFSQQFSQGSSGNRDSFERNSQERPFGEERQRERQKEKRFSHCAMNTSGLAENAWNYVLVVPMLVSMVPRNTEAVGFELQLVIEECEEVVLPVPVSVPAAASLATGSIYRLTPSSFTRRLNRRAHSSTSLRSYLEPFQSTPSTDLAHLDPNLDSRDRERLEAIEAARERANKARDRANIETRERENEARERGNIETRERVNLEAREGERPDSREEARDRIRLEAREGGPRDGARDRPRERMRIGPRERVKDGSREGSRGRSRDEQIEDLEQCDDTMRLTRYKSPNTLEFKYMQTDATDLNDSQPLSLFFDIANGRATLLQFAVMPLTDVGGTLSIDFAVSPYTNTTGHNVSVALCLRHLAAPESTENCSLRLVSDTSAENFTDDGAEVQSIQVPYPAPGPWYIRLEPRCLHVEHEADEIESAEIACDTNATSVLLDITSAPCHQGKCGAHGKCFQYVVDSGVILSSCVCRRGWRGWFCNDDSEAPSDDQLLLNFLLLTLSNGLFVPAVALAVVRRHFSEAMVYAVTMACSALYHACDSDFSQAFCAVDIDVLQFGDFFSAILAFWVTLVTLANLPSPARALLHLFGGIVIAFAVEIDKTSLWTFAVPAGLGGLLLVLAWCCRCCFRRRCFPGGKLWCLSVFPGLALTAAGLVIYAFFETEDNYGLTHSCWHGLMALAVLFLVPSMRRQSDDDDACKVSVQNAKLTAAHVEWRPSYSSFKFLRDDSDML